MNSYPVPDSLAHHYKGCGIALGATDNSGALVAMVYVRDIDSDFSDEISDVPALADNERVAAVARALEKDFGFVRVGMVSAWEFNEL